MIIYPAATSKIYLVHYCMKLAFDPYYYTINYWQVFIINLS